MTRLSAAPKTEPKRRVSVWDAARILASRDPVIARLIAPMGSEQAEKERPGDFEVLSTCNGVIRQTPAQQIDRLVGKTRPQPPAPDAANRKRGGAGRVAQRRREPGQ